MIRTFSTGVLTNIHPATNNKYYKLLQKLLKLNVMRGCNDYDKYNLPEDWVTFKQYDNEYSVVHSDKGIPHECYNNALKYAIKTNSKFMLGVVIYTDEVVNAESWMNKDKVNKFNPMLVMVPHAWNIVDGNPYDITYDFTHKPHIYAGELIDPSEFRTSKELERHLLSIIKL